MNLVAVAEAQVKGACAQRIRQALRLVPAMQLRYKIAAMDAPRSLPRRPDNIGLCQYLSLADGDVFVHRGGRPGQAVADGPVLVFLHEALGCDSMWKGVPTALSDATRLPFLTYDRLGHGRSGPLPGPRDERYLEVEAYEVLPAVLEASGVTDPILVGHSDGGTIALMYASRRRVRAVVAEAAHVFVEEVTLAGIRAAVETWDTTDLDSRLARHHGDKTAALFRAWAETWLSEPFRSWNVESCLAGVAAPVLVVQGADDEYGTLRQVEAIAGGVSGPSRTLLVPGCRHIPHLQAPDTVLPAIADFVLGHIEG